MGPRVLRGWCRLWSGVCSGLGVLSLLTSPVVAAQVPFMRAVGAAIEVFGTNKGYSGVMIGQTENAVAAQSMNDTSVGASNGNGLAPGLSLATPVIGFLGPMAAPIVSAPALPEAAAGGCAAAGILCPVGAGVALVLVGAGQYWFYSKYGWSNTNPNNTDQVPLTPGQISTVYNENPDKNGNKPTGLSLSGTGGDDYYGSLGDPCGLLQAKVASQPNPNVYGNQSGPFVYSTNVSHSQSGTDTIYCTIGTTYSGTYRSITSVAVSYTYTNVQLCGALAIHKTSSTAACTTETVGDATGAITGNSIVFYPTTPNSSNPDPGKQLVVNTPGGGAGVTLNPAITATYVTQEIQKASAVPGYSGIPGSQADLTSVTAATTTAPAAQTTVASLGDAPAQTQSQVTSSGGVTANTDTTDQPQVCNANCGNTTQTSCSNNVGATSVCSTTTNPQGSTDQSKPIDTTAPNVSAPSAGNTVLATALAPLLTLFPQLTSWSAPGHTGSCPSFSLSLDFFKGQTFSDDTYCTLIESNRSLITGVCVAAMVLMSLLIVLAA